MYHTKCNIKHHTRCHTDSALIQHWKSEKCRSAAAIEYLKIREMQQRCSNWMSAFQRCTAALQRLNACFRHSIAAALQCNTEIETFNCCSAACQHFSAAALQCKHSFAAALQRRSTTTPHFFRKTRFVWQSLYFSSHSCSDNKQNINSATKSQKTNPDSVMIMNDPRCS